MRRLPRHLFTLCSAVSVLLCVATCVLWVRSLTHWDSVYLRVGQHLFSVYSVASEISLGWSTRGIGLNRNFAVETQPRAGSVFSDGIAYLLEHEFRASPGDTRNTARRRRTGSSSSLRRPRWR
jgi:hypothetical protein